MLPISRPLVLILQCYHLLNRRWVTFQFAEINTWYSTNQAVSHFKNVTERKYYKYLLILYYLAGQLFYFQIVFRHRMWSLHLFSLTLWCKESCDLACRRKMAAFAKQVWHLKQPIYAKIVFQKKALFASVCFMYSNFQYCGVPLCYLSGTLNNCTHLMHDNSLCVHTSTVEYNCHLLSSIIFMFYFPNFQILG